MINWAINQFCNSVINYLNHTELISDHSVIMDKRVVRWRRVVWHAALKERHVSASPKLRGSQDPSLLIMSADLHGIPWWNISRLGKIPDPWAQLSPRRPWPPCQPPTSSTTWLSGSPGAPKGLQQLVSLVSTKHLEWKPANHWILLNYFFHVEFKNIQQSTNDQNQ